MTQAQLDSILKKRNPVKEKKPVVEPNPPRELNLDTHIAYLKEKMKEEAPTVTTQENKKLKTYVFKRVKNSTCGWEVDEAATLKNQES